MARPGGHATYAIGVWLTAGKNGSAKIQLSAEPKRLSPHFTVCQPKGRSTCAIAGLDAGQKVELRATIAVPKHGTAKHITLIVTGRSPQTGRTANARLSVLVRAHKAKHSTTHGRSHGSSTVPPASPVGITLPNGLSLSQLSPGSSSSTGSLPALPTPVNNPGSAFPEVSPSPNVSSAARAVLPPPRAIPAADVAATAPLESRLIGGQVAGLAILAAAVMILLARLAVRKRRPRQDSDSA